MMGDIPITFMGEIFGESYRVSETTVFQHEQLPTGGLKRSNSQLMLALADTGDDEKEEQVTYA
jgi:hypothetical protein